MKLTEFDKLGTGVKRVAAVAAVCLGSGIGGFMVEPAASAATTAPNAATIFSELTAVESLQPTHAAQLGQSVTLPAKSWIQEQLARTDLTVQERQVLQQAPASVTNDGSVATNSMKMADGDPVMTNVCNAKDILGLSQATSSVYWGYTAGGYNITHVATPNVYWTSSVYTRTGYTVSTSQPGPLAMEMAATQHPHRHIGGDYEALTGLAFHDVKSN